MLGVVSSILQADSQPKSVGLVWGLAAARCSVYIHRMNRVLSQRPSYDDIANALLMVIIMDTRLATESALCFYIFRRIFSNVQAAFSELFPTVTLCRHS